MVTVHADAGGAFSATVPAPFGTSVITVAVTTASGATGYARRTVVSDFITGTTVLDVTDPSGDDNGPGTFAYPTVRQLQARGVRHRAVPGDRVRRQRRAAAAHPRPLPHLRITPWARSWSTCSCTTPAPPRPRPAPPFASRNYSIADNSAWSSRIEVQGFASPVFVDAAGQSLGTVSVTASQASRYITMFVPLAALGTPGPGWKFTVVLHGQDGFSGDQARGFQPTPQDFQFGLCASPSVVSPICSIDPGTAPKAMDVITPAGVDQSVELDPTQGPVRIEGVAVP